MSKTPIVYILPQAKMKLDTYISLAKGEISGLGSLSLLENQNFLILDVFIFEQKCTPVATDLDKNAISKFIYQTVASGGNPALFKLWWHSHAYMDVFWSKETDEKTIDGFMNEWMISLVGNKKGDYLARVDIYKPIRITLDNLPFRVLLLPDEELKKQLAQQVNNLVTFTEPNNVLLGTIPPMPPLPFKKHGVVRKVRKP